MLAGVDMITGVGMVAGGRIFSFVELMLGTEVTAAARAAVGAAATTGADAGDAARRVADRLCGPDGGVAACEAARLFARRRWQVTCLPRSRPTSTPSCGASWPAEVAGGRLRPGRRSGRDDRRAVRAAGLAACGTKAAPRPRRPRPSASPRSSAIGPRPRGHDRRARHAGGRRKSRVRAAEHGRQRRYVERFRRRRGARGRFGPRPKTVEIRQLDWARVPAALTAGSVRRRHQLDDDRPEAVAQARLRRAVFVYSIAQVAVPSAGPPSRR